MLAVADWSVHRWVSHLHLAEAIVSGLPLAIRNVDKSLADGAARIQDVLAVGETTTQLRPELRVYWRALIGAAAGRDDVDERLAAFEHCVRDQEDQCPIDRDHLKTALADFFRFADDLLPRIESELALRIRPLRDAWEARGPGLMKQIQACFADDRFENPAILPVLPVIGGAGSDHYPWPSVRIEAVLANPRPALPEVLRIAWLIAVWQTRCLLARNRIAIDERTMQLACIPLVLHASEQVQLAAFDETQTVAAINHWCEDDDKSLSLANSLIGWWNSTASESRWLDRIGRLRDRS